MGNESVEQTNEYLVSIKLTGEDLATVRAFLASMGDKVTFLGKFQKEVNPCPYCNLSLDREGMEPYIEDQGPFAGHLVHKDCYNENHEETFQISQDTLNATMTHVLEDQLAIEAMKELPPLDENNAPINWEAHFYFHNEQELDLFRKLTRDFNQWTSGSSWRIPRTRDLAGEVVTPGED